MSLGGSHSIIYTYFGHTDEPNMAAILVSAVILPRYSEPKRKMSKLAQWRLSLNLASGRDRWLVGMAASCQLRGGAFTRQRTS